VITLRRDGELAAVLPLLVRRGERRSLTNWHTPELAIPAADDAARAALVRAVLARTRLPLTLTMVTDGRPETDVVRAAASATGMRMLSHTSERSPYVDLAGDWATYEQTLARRRRSELRRRRRRLEEQGAVAFDVQYGDARLDDLLAEGFAVEGSGWKAREGTAILSRPETRAFYTDVARWAAARGTLRLGFLRLDGRAVAFHLTLAEAGNAYLLKGGYDPALRALAPGQLLIAEMLRWAFDSGLHTYDFLGEDEGFKLDWTAAFRERLTLQAFPRTTGAALGFVVYAYGRPVVKRARALARSR
jgi:CelD/BcsL family acetyltransferase involved in cellulose biosynthesis